MLDDVATVATLGLALTLSFLGALLLAWLCLRALMSALGWGASAQMAVASGGAMTIKHGVKGHAHDVSSPQ